MNMKDKIEVAAVYMQKIALNEGRDWISPTEIGRSVGGFDKHSSYGSPICKAAVEAGIMERNKKGWYKLVRKFA